MAENLNAVIEPATPEYYMKLLRESGQWYDGDLVKAEILDNIIRRVSPKDAETYQIVPLCIEPESKTNKSVLVLITDIAQNAKIVDRLESLFGMPVKILFCENHTIIKGLKYYYNVDGKSPANLFAIREHVIAEDDDSDDVSEQDINTPLQKKLENILITACNKKASDIHLDPNKSGITVRFCIDGRLVDVTKDFVINGKKEKNALINLVKNKCEPKLNIANSLMPEDGSFSLNYDGRNISFRVSTLPTNLGQNATIRVLPTSRTVLDLNRLGFTEEDNKKISYASSTPSGLFLVVGPTSSGKTTTLYSIVQGFGGLANKTITIEDPVEYNDDSLTQVQIREVGDEKLILDAPKILKAALRQAPKNILYGEVRDERDADVCIQAAQTGHRVLSTLHARSVITALDRLFDMGIKRSSLLTEINCIIAQRLVGLLCTTCSSEYIPVEDSTLSKENALYLQGGSPRVAGNGCKFCNGGYLGQTVVAEVLVFDNQLRDFLKVERGIKETLDMLREKYTFKTLWEKSLDLVFEGKVDIKEVLRVVNTEN